MPNILTLLAEASQSIFRAPRCCRAYLEYFGGALHLLLSFLHHRIHHEHHGVGQCVQPVLISIASGGVVAGGDSEPELLIKGHDVLSHDGAHLQ